MTPAASSRGRRKRRAALAFANDQCRASSWGRKRARITNMRRVYGDYIVYECLFDGPLRRNGPG